MLRVVAVVLSLVCLASVWACSSNKAQPARIELERFVIKDYNWEINGYDVLVVNADASVTYVGALPLKEEQDGKEILRPVWHRVDREVEPATVKALVAELEKVPFHALDAEYVDETIHDGQNIEYVLATRTGVKRVRFRNRFPPQIEKLRRFLQSELVGPLRAALPSAPRLTNDEATKFWTAL
jgi:hypothetical protein